MWPKANLEYPADEMLRKHLTAAGVRCVRMDVVAHREWETAWRKIYQRAFVSGCRFRQGARAVEAYFREAGGDWILAPFLSSVPGTGVRVHRLQMNAFECDGPLQELSDFLNVEFFVSPKDLRWTFVRTHEDFSFGGPYFARKKVEVGGGLGGV